MDRNDIVTPVPLLDVSLKNPWEDERNTTLDQTLLAAQRVAGIIMTKLDGQYKGKDGPELAPEMYDPAVLEQVLHKINEIKKLIAFGMSSGRTRKAESK